MSELITRKTQPRSVRMLTTIAFAAGVLCGLNPGAPVPVDLVTASGSGLDPDISPASAEFQVGRVASKRHMAPGDLRALLRKHTRDRQLSVLGELRVNVLELNLDLDALRPLQ